MGKTKTQEMAPAYTVELVEKRNAHYYRVDGGDTLYPGVTTVLSVLAKPALIPWAANEAARKIKAYLIQHAQGRPLTADEIDKLVEDGRKAHGAIKDEAANFGTRAHQAIDIFIKTGVSQVKEDILPVFQAFCDWKQKTHIEIIGGDLKIASMEYGYGGSLDALGLVDGKVVIVDFKTSNRINPEYALQVAAYSNSYAEMFGLDYIPEAYILRLGKKTPDFEVRKVKSIQSAFRQFVSALSIWRGQKEELLEAA